MSHVSFDFPDDLLEAVRAAVGPDDLEAWVLDALRKKLATNELDRLLVQIAEEVGPLPQELVAEADAAWLAS
jgi:hypothetical protein